MSFLRRPFVYAGLFSLCLLAFTAFVLLDTYVVPHAISQVGESSSPSADENSEQTRDSSAGSGSESAGTAVITETSYEDGRISIQLSTLRVYDTSVYLVDIQMEEAGYLKTALAQDTFGTNITQKTSEMAAENQAILAVNGDYYGANSQGYVIKNGVLYRDSIRRDSENDDLAIYADGSFAVIRETEISAQELLADGVQQLLAFGPVLLEDGAVTVSDGDEVGKAMASNPRTAIGLVEPLHYVLAVSDGRTSESRGLTLVQLAQVMQEAGCTIAYNLDGGGSSTLYFNGRVVNNPTTNGRTIAERAVSDIVYVGYT